VDLFTLGTSTGIRFRARVGLGVVVRRAVGGLLLADPASLCVVAIFVAQSLANLVLSTTARAFSCGRLGGLVRAARQFLAVVPMILLGVLQMSSYRAVAVSVARSGDARGGAVGAFGAVVSNVALSACDTLAALVLLGALVTVLWRLLLVNFLLASLLASLFASLLGGVLSAATLVVGSASTGGPLVGGLLVGLDVGESSWVSLDEALWRCASPFDRSASSALVAFASGCSALSALGVLCVLGTTVVIKAEANAVSLVLQGALWWVVGGALLLALSTNVSEV